MKLNYIVNIDFEDKVARSVQVKANAKLFYERLGVHFKCIGVGRSAPPLIGLWVGGIKRSSSLVRKILFHLQSVRYFFNVDVVYSRNLTVLFLARLFGKRLVYEIHDGLHGLNYRLFSYVKSDLLVVAISAALQQYLEVEFSMAEDRVLVAHDGVFAEPYEALRSLKKEDLRSELKLPKDRFIVMHSGNLYKGRGAELFEGILRNFPEVYFVQVGGMPSDIANWKAHYQEYSNIHFAGFHSGDRLVKYQMCADLLFLPMTHESSIWWCTSPMKLFEYMATGAPILASNIGSVGEILDDSNCFTFNSKSEESLRRALEVCIASPDLAHEKSKKALALVLAKYTWKHRVLNIVDFISKRFALD
jgi:glycosyltransferase involved in cell wall biosynthesis